MSKRETAKYEYLRGQALSQALDAVKSLNDNSEMVMDAAKMTDRKEFNRAYDLVKKVCDRTPTFEQQIHALRMKLLTLVSHPPDADAEKEGTK